MAVSREEILKITRLANLTFSDSELEAFTEQFQNILEYVEKLGEVDITGVDPTSHVSLAEKAPAEGWRADEVRESLPVSESLGNAPDPGDDHFLVPKVL